MSRVRPATPAASPASLQPLHLAQEAIRENCCVEMSVVHLAAGADTSGDDLARLDEAELMGKTIPKCRLRPILRHKVHHFAHCFGGPV